MRMLTVDVYRGLFYGALGGDLYKRIEKPCDAQFADRVIRGLEAEIICDVLPARITCVFSRVIEHLRPNLVEFRHMARIERYGVKRNFVVLF